jgi:hypothetical protein
MTAAGYSKLVGWSSELRAAAARGMAMEAFLDTCMQCGPQQQAGPL